MGQFRSRLACLALVMGTWACKPPTPGIINSGGTCGNSVVEGSEVCDDGNRSGNDGCSAACDSDETCGNDVVDNGELCDDGNLLGGDGCSADCTSDEMCGNNVIDLAIGETCDDGNLISGDGCSANCQSNEACGNGVTDANVGEDCDTGAVASAACDPDCTVPECGDTIVNMAAGEECDDSNLANNDFCVGAGCKTARCGDTFRRTVGANPEQCDDGNTLDNDLCVGAGCQTARCGDTFVRTVGANPEQCDDGNFTNNDFCVGVCRDARCGDTFVRTQGANPEQCDDGNQIDTDDCPTTCNDPVCGDGFKWAGHEDCDDGNTIPGDGCDTACKWEPRSYVVSDPADLINMANCNVGSDDYSDSCNTQPIGFSWTDASPFQPAAVIVELDRGMNCNPLETRMTALDGVFSGDFQINPGDCVCGGATEEIHTWNLTSVGSYQLGVANTFLIEGSPDCIGLSFDPGLGGFARITVFP